MERRKYIKSVLSVGLIGSTAGCSQHLSPNILLDSLSHPVIEQKSINVTHVGFEDNANVFSTTVTVTLVNNGYEGNVKLLPVSIPRKLSNKAEFVKQVAREKNIHTEHFSENEEKEISLKMDKHDPDRQFEVIKWPTDYTVRVINESTSQVTIKLFIKTDHDKQNENIIGEKEGIKLSPESTENITINTSRTLSDVFQSQNVKVDLKLQNPFF